MTKRNEEDEKEIAALKNCLVRVKAEVREARETTRTLMMFSAASGAGAAIIAAVNHKLSWFLIGGFVTALLGASAIGSYRNTKKFAELIPQIKADLVAYGETGFGFHAWDDVDNQFDAPLARIKRWFLQEVVGIEPLMPLPPRPGSDDWEEAE